MRVTIMPLGTVSSTVTDEIASVIGDRFNTEIEVQSKIDPPADAYDTTRDQYDAKQLVSLVESAGTGDKNLAIMRGDLFIEDRNYIFGLAKFDGDSGIVSLNRLVKTKNGGSVDPNTARKRVRKEVVHEFGHLMGYRHCRNDHCVMRLSSEVSQIDNKYDRFCRSCRG